MCVCVCAMLPFPNVLSYAASARLARHPAFLRRRIAPRKMRAPHGCARARRVAWACARAPRTGRRKRRAECQSRPSPLPASEPQRLECACWRDPPGRVGWHRHVGVGSDRTRDRAVTHPRREANVARRRARRCNANCVASSATAQRLVPRSVCERPAEPRGGAQAPRADTPKAEREMETRPPL